MSNNIQTQTEPYSFRIKEDFQFAYDKINLEDGGMSRFEKDMLYNITKSDFENIIPQTSTFSNGSNDVAGSIFDVSDTDLTMFVNAMQVDESSKDDVVEVLKELVEEEKKAERIRLDTMIAQKKNKDGFKQDTENIIREKLSLSPTTPITETHIETFVANWGLSDDSENSLKKTFGFNAN